MVTYKCKNCGGELEFGGAGSMKCPYCGSKAFFSDADFKGNEEFRKKLLQYYKAEAERKENDYSADSLWTVEGKDSFTLQSGQPLNIEYMKKYPYPGFVCYLARESVVYIFDSSKDAARFSAGLRKLTFPEADTRLHRSFPEIKLELSRSGGKHALVFKRRPMLYPAEMFAPWDSTHLAWVISRMENICCALQYSEITHGGISPASVWVDPLQHEGALFGDWRGVRQLGGNGDLYDLRKTAITLAKNTREPEQLYKFLNSAPEADAFSDFAKWDKVIADGFGGHKFQKMKF